ncbi:VTT domain-containing protein [Caulobacter sp.]|uniref:DedA family protein n=1 Tax=Caulobacter sp. TaxID=78 RepID=UPI0025BE0D0E|nr:VTT domain-containing protein [Caulobacter sp.]MBQ1562871.1 VTT domain-containing protein [Caulobacter sp.]
MEDVLIDIEQWLRAGVSWAGPALAIGALLESLVLVGAVVPATPVLVAIGGVMAAGHAPPTLLAWAAAGAFAGNWTSYELGAAARRRNLRLPSRLGDQVGQVTESLFARCGPGAIIVGRFMGPAASVAPFAAGWGAMRRSRFLLANAATCILWPSVMASLGYFGVEAVLAL